MKKPLTYSLFVIPTLLLICLICFRRHSTSGIRGEFGVGPNGVLKISGAPLLRSEFIWTNRTFVQIQGHDEISNFLGDSVAQLSLNAAAKNHAIQSCWGMLKAYSTGDWGAFQTVRFPVSDYDISPAAVKQFKFKGIILDATNALAVYHETWTNLFSNGGLFTTVSMISNSVSVLEIPLARLDQISFPEFTDITNQNWIKIVSNTTFDYSRHLSMQKTSRAQFLRFFFFGKSDAETCAYMFSFVWDENNQNWLPCRMTVGYVRKPVHIVGYF